MKLIKELESKIDSKGKKKRKRRWGLFQCPACGEKVERDYYAGTRNKTCGCIKWYDASRKKHLKHGYCLRNRPERIYKIWVGIKSRCYNKKVNNYSRYGGRGIIVCNKWKNDFIAFKEWALKNGYSDTLQIDRIDNNGNYSPDNCRFVTCAKNNQNRNCNKLNMKRANEIRRLYKDIKDMSYQKLADSYDVDKALIGRIVRNEAWVCSEASK
jgi:hypothetical protein